MGSRDLRKRPRVLVVEDEPSEREGLVRLVGRWGYEVEAAASAEEALNMAESYRPEIVVTDLVLPEMDGLKLLQRMKETTQPPAVLLITGHGTVEAAVEAMRHGAADFLTKPIDAAHLQVRLERVLEQATLTREVDILRRELRQSGRYGHLVGQTSAMQEVYDWIKLAASSTAPVLVVGESGTGKELVARTIHDQSERTGAPFITVNCAAIPETLLESEFFGHERGAFTGANERRLGCFELADGGTLFLDEIAEMDVFMQAKLLRVLQDASFRRVGGKAEVNVDVRLITATNRQPADAIAKGKLRDDLFYRINVVTVELPPLRERSDDIPLLVKMFIDEFNQREKRSVEGVTEEVDQMLLRHSWRGNVRELRNVIHRAVVLASTGLIAREHLPRELREEAPSPAPAGNVTVTPIREMERVLIVQALEAVAWDKRRSAAMLGISLKTLYNKLAKYGIPLTRPAP